MPQTNARRAPLNRTSSQTSTSAFINASAVAQASRNFAYTNALSVSIPAKSSNLPQIETSQPGTPASVSGPPSPFLFSSSAPAAHFLASPHTSFEVGSVDSQASDYFGSPASYFGSPFLQSTLESNQSTTINPSQLFGAPPGAHASDERPGSLDLLDAQSPSSKHPLSRLAASGFDQLSRSSSTPDVAGLVRSGSTSKATSAPASRTHSRSNTVSVPPPLVEGQALDSSSIGKDSKKPANDGNTSCINCGTTVGSFVCIRFTLAHCVTLEHSVVETRHGRTPSVQCLWSFQESSWCRSAGES